MPNLNDIRQQVLRENSAAQRAFDAGLKVLFLEDDQDLQERILSVFSRHHGYLPSYSLREDRYSPFAGNGRLP